MIIDYDPETNKAQIESYTNVISSDTPLSSVYLSACDYSEVMTQNMYTSSDFPSDTPSDSSVPPRRRPPPETFQSIFAAQKKKYKPVAKKARPIPTTLPQKYHIVRNIVGDPLENMPPLNPNPPPVPAHQPIHPRTKRRTRQNSSGLPFTRRMRPHARLYVQPRSWFRMDR